MIISILIHNIYYNCFYTDKYFLFQLPLSMHEPPKPYPTHKIDKWSHGYVRLPCSAHCFCPVDQVSHMDCNTILIIDSLKNYTIFS